MRSKKRLGVALVAAILGAAMFHGEGVAQETQEFSLVVRVGDKAYSYSSDQLEAMATVTYASPRGKEAPAVPIAVLVTQDTQLSMDQILQIVIVGEKTSLLLEAEDLAHAAHLLVKVGFNKATLVPDSETGATWQAIRPLLGRPRLKYLETVYVFWQNEPRKAALVE